MRAFLAIPIPPELQQSLVVAGQPFSDLHCVHADNLHLTLKFLGDVRDPVAVAEAVEQVCAAHSAFDLTLARVGCFPDRRHARVVWVGLSDGELAAGALASGIEQALVPLGFEPEGRPWRGHVTLGRFRTRKRLRASSLDDEHIFGSFRAEEVVLFSSQLTPEGAVHTPVYRLPLGV